jgi:hypothetical protein
MAEQLLTGFITGNHTASWLVWPMQKGEVDVLTPYPTDGTPGTELRVEDVRYEKYIGDSGEYEWRLLFNVTNLMPSPVVYDVYWTRDFAS